ncbi:hypothetical protein [Microbacterium aurantiacum]|uniref:hypothetical protein n=1 Tax=Microbacterium aurantiacum TaxID=162393 RepID=UPI000C7FDD99|nr:hypothetical protein [Microbacterium aurantiacum]
MMKTPLQELVDAMLDDAQATHPGIEFSITLSPANSLLLHRDADRLNRPTADGREGYYVSHVYRDCMVWDQPIYEHLVIVGPVTGTIPEADDVPVRYGDLRTLQFSTNVPTAE